MSAPHHDKLNCYILATVNAPFGPVDQVSERMQLSEAAFRVEGYERGWKGRATFRIVRLQHDEGHAT